MIKQSISSIDISGGAFKYPGIGLGGGLVDKSKYDSPYSYDCHVTWQSPELPAGHNFLADTGLNFLYSDRMVQWNLDKYDMCAHEIWGNKRQTFDRRQPLEIERFLRLYLENDQLQLVVVGEGANQSSGYPYWVFGYSEK